MHNITNADRVSPTWGKLMALAKQRIEDAHKQLESVSLTPSQTDIVRGRIMSWRELEGLDREEPIVP